MLLAMRVESLSERLRELGAVVDRYERGDPEFTDVAIAWLRATEQLLLSLRTREGAELSTLRASITKAGERCALDGSEHVSRRSVVRRARAVAAAEALERAGAIIQQTSADDEARLRHFESKLIEALTAGVLVGLVPYPPEEPHERWLALIWQRLASHQATRPTAVYLAAALRAPDRLYVLDRVISRLVETQFGVLTNMR